MMIEKIGEIEKEGKRKWRWYARWMQVLEIFRNIFFGSIVYQ